MKLKIMKTIKIISVFILMVFFLVPGRAQENTMAELETVLKDVPNLFKSIRGEVIPTYNGNEWYSSTIQHEKSDIAEIGVLKGLGAIYSIKYKYEADPEFAILTFYTTFIYSLENEGYRVESSEEEIDGVSFDIIMAFDKGDRYMMEMRISDTGYEILIYAYE